MLSVGAAAYGGRDAVNPLEAIVVGAFLIVIVDVAVVLENGLHVVGW